MNTALRHKKTSSQKIRKRTNTSPFWKFLSRNQKRFTLVWILTGLALLVLVTVVILERTLLSEKYTIEQITYAESSVSVYDHPAIYKEISTALSGKNYFMTKRFGMDELHSQLRSNFPIIQSVALSQAGEQSVFVEISFHTPYLVFATPGRAFALYEQHFFDLTTGNTLGNQTTRLLLPDYTSGYDSLDGILYEIDEVELLEQIQMIENTLGSQHIGPITYLPGGIKVIVPYKGKTVFFHLDKDVDTQLTKLIDMENHFEEFPNLTKIDAGSIDDLIVK